MCRRLLANPWRLRRLGLALILTAALAAGAAAALRARLPPGTTRHSATYLLDTAGWLLAAGGAVVEARVGDLLLTAGHRAARRRAVAFAAFGIVAALGGCFSLSAFVSGALGGLARGIAAAALVGGVGLGLAGLFTLVWHYGGRYAADRIQRMGEEDW